MMIMACTRCCTMRRWPRQNTVINTAHSTSQGHCTLETAWSSRSARGAFHVVVISDAARRKHGARRLRWVCHKKNTVPCTFPKCVSSVVG